MSSPNQNRRWIATPCFGTVALVNLQVLREKNKWSSHLGGIQSLPSASIAGKHLLLHYPVHPLCVVCVWNLMFRCSAWKRAYENKQILNQTVDWLKRLINSKWMYSLSWEGEAWWLIDSEWMQFYLLMRLIIIIIIDESISLSVHSAYAFISKRPAISPFARRKRNNNISLSVQ